MFLGLQSSPFYLMPNLIKEEKKCKFVLNSRLITDLDERGALFGQLLFKFRSCTYMNFAFSNNHLKDFGKLNNNMCHAKRSCGFLES